MNNQRGEVVAGVMVVMMVGMMLFGMVFVHGGHGDHKEHTRNDRQIHSETGQHHMHQSDMESAGQSEAVKGN